MGWQPEALEEDLQDAPLPAWAAEFAEKPVPLREAARLVGVSLSKAKQLVSSHPRLVRFRRASVAGGRPAPHVLPSALGEFASGGRESPATARFARRCRIAGVNPAQTLWRIVTGCLPDVDKLIDAMRHATDENIEQGTPLFLQWVGGTAMLPKGDPRSVPHWLARYILRNCSRSVPRGDFAKVWVKVLRKVEAEGRIFRHFVPQKVDDRWRLSEVPDYWRNLKFVPAYAGEPRVLERASRKLRAVAAIGEMLLASGSGSRESNLVGKARRVMLGAKPSPRFPAFEQGRGLEIESVKRKVKPSPRLSDFEQARGFDVEHDPASLDFSGSVGGLASLGADSRAEKALMLMMAAGVSVSHARAFLRAHWWRGKNPFNAKLSASAVRQIFGMTTRARTGKHPERRRKSD